MEQIANLFFLMLLEEVLILEFTEELFNETRIRL